MESREEKVRACVGRVRDKGAPVSFGRGEGKALISWDLASPLALGTFLSPESWEGWRSRKGVWGT